MAPALLMAGGAVVALLAVLMASLIPLTLAALLLIAGIAVTTVRARRLLDRPAPKVAIVGGVVALGAAIFVPASQNVDRCARLGPDADLAGCDLSGRDLTAENLRGADLSDADLSDTDLAGVNLGLVNLRGINLRGANLSRARIANATAIDADLRDANLDGAVLVESDLTDAVVEDATFTGAELTGAELADLDLSGADLTGAKLDDADLSGANLSRSHLAGADLSDANLSGANLSGADLAGEEGAPTTLAGADLSNADLSGADLTNVGAPHAEFEGADFTGAHLQENDFVGARGVTGEDFVAAFDVPPGQLAGETARRGVVLQSYEEIVRAVTPVRDGRAVPAVQPYVANNAFHPAIVFDAPVLPGAPSWADTVRDQWAPTAIRYAELVVVVTRGRESVETCPYVYASGVLAGRSAPSITRYVPTVTVKVFAAHDHRLVGERTYRGGDPRQCPQFEGTGTTELEGSPPDSGQARPWLADIVNPPN